MRHSFVNFTELLTALPDLQTVEIIDHNNATWISEILQVKQHSLMDLSFTYLCFDETDNIDNNLLLTFLKAQRPGFQLMFQIQTENVGPFVTKLMEFVDQKLARGGGAKQTDSNGKVRWTHTRFYVCNGYQLRKPWHLTA